MAVQDRKVLLQQCRDLGSGHIAVFTVYVAHKIFLGEHAANTMAAVTAVRVSVVGSIRVFYPCILNCYG